MKAFKTKQELNRARDLSSYGTILLIATYIRKYVEDYKHDPEILRRMLKNDNLVSLMCTDDYIDYIVDTVQEEIGA